MSQDIEISVYQTVGSPLCVATHDGQKVHDRIAPALKKGRKVIVSFANVSNITSAFLNAAIGQLYGEFSEDKIKAGLQISNLEPEDRALLKRVIETAKAYFKDPDRFSQARRKALEEYDEQ